MDVNNKIDGTDIYLNYKVDDSFLFTKRIVDIIISFFGLLFLFPFLIIISILIKIDDPKGNVIYRQKRVGKNQTTFVIYKFRSMYSNAEERLDDLLKYNDIHGAMFKMKKDPRITRIGKYLRKYSVDELPQLINVLNGTMSLVGPRPPLLREVKEYSVYDKQRLIVKPGITGLWQVSGRNSLSFDEMVKLDIQYIKNQSILTDLKILMKTVRVVITAEEAF